ncbi:MAG TPA: protein kinase [Ktedonobacteraceae bacterium]
MRDIPQNQKTTIGSYRLLRFIGTGPLSHIYLAEHGAHNQQKLVVKILQAVPLEFVGTQQQALLEARRLTLLSQRHILPLLDAGIDEKQFYLIYPYAEAGSLAQRLTRTALLSTKEALTILKHVGEALHVAHLQQFVHADVKPENVLFLPNGEAALADFRIQALAQAEQSARDSLLASASYMAPEQFQGMVTSFSDQYALACLAYRLLTGQPVFQASDVETLARKHASESPVSPALAQRENIQHLTPVLLKALAKQPEQRYPDVTAFLAALLAPPPLSTLIHTYKMPQVQAASAATLETRKRPDANANGVEQALFAGVEQHPLSTPPIPHTPAPNFQPPAVETRTPDPALNVTAPPTSGPHAAVPPLSTNGTQKPVQTPQTEDESKRDPRPAIRIPGQAAAPASLRGNSKRRVMLIALCVAFALLASLFASPLLSNSPLFHHIEASQASPSHTPTTTLATATSQSTPTATPTTRPTVATRPTATPTPVRPTATPTPRPIPPTSYEAESTANTLGGSAVIFSCPPCSGGKKVGRLGQGGTLLFNGIRAGKTAAYKITFYFVDGRGDRSASISINGGPALAYTFHGANDNNWNEVQTLTITVQLTAGTNTLFISNPSASAPDIDRVVVS